jgi:3-oxoadipate enol-lactonase
MTRLHSVREGKGPLVVLSHALGLDLHMWDGVAALLRDDHTVLRYDHRNHGKSEVVPGPLTVEMLADDAADLIRSEAGGQPVRFVGLSMGGMAAQALAAAHPELLASVTIANSSAHYPDKTPWQARVQTVQGKGIEGIADAAVARWLTPPYIVSHEGAAAAAKLRSTLVASDAAGYIASCEAVSAIDFRESNKRIKVPTLVIAGAQDEATPPVMSQEIADAIAGAKLVTIDAAHISAMERPEDFVQLLRAFWSSVP